MSAKRYFVHEEETLEGEALRGLQRRKLGAMLREVLGRHVGHGPVSTQDHGTRGEQRTRNEFYRGKLGGIGFDALRDSIEELPFTTRGEIEADQAAHGPYGTNLTYSAERYCRLHQTSGTAGRPVRWLDTKDSWEWFKKCWGIIYTAAGITAADRCMFPFSFGPFIGFWAAFESAVALGNLALAAGGMTTAARLNMILANEITVLGCTPTYALHMAEVAAAEGLDIRRSDVRALIVAGEPGGNIPATRKRLEEAWGARVFDHTGMTEIGSLGFECVEAPGGVHLIESECIVEVIDPSSGKVLGDGEMGELVLTNLGRWGSPLIRYRTGDQVRVTRGKCACGRAFARMEGGILGRIDDMVVVRGNNLFPTAIESVVRQFVEVAEFQVETEEGAGLTEVRVRVEGLPGVEREDLVERVGQRIHDVLGFRVGVEAVGVGELPRFEMKARRLVRHRVERVKA